MRKFSIILIFLVLSSCTKKEVNVISGNQAPDEYLVTTELKENYINRLFITLQGRKATDVEFDDAKFTLGENAEQFDREILLQNILNSSDYKVKLYEDARADYLESVDTVLIGRDYQTLVALQLSIPPELKDALEFELTRHKKLYEVPQKLDSNLIDLIEVHKRVVNNQYYDDINMGTENFVVACFQNFLFRYPTDSELLNSSLMIEGSNGLLFLQAGFSKNDFMDIFFSSQGYYEGQVLTLYNKYLFRNPSSQEMHDQTLSYSINGNYKELQTQLLSSDEYFFNEY